MLISQKKGAGPASVRKYSERLQPLKRHVVVRAESKGSARQPWDFSRFVSTLAFFDALPTPDKIITGIIRKITGAQEAPKASAVIPLTSAPALGSAASASTESVIMVTGATGGVGKRVVARLLAQGRVVRALVRDIEKAKSMLSSLPVSAGGRLELCAADLSQKKTLLPEFFEGVRGLVVCSAVKVQPKEGDNQDRSKYYQGIKFYDPEIVGDTPEAVEYLGVSNLIEAARESLGLVAGRAISLDQERWGPLDDVVMGGVSKSAAVRVKGAGEDGGDALVFRGDVSTDNSGGFTSVRTRNFVPPLDLGAYEGIALRVKGNGLRYKVIIRADDKWDGIAHCKSVDTVAGEWQTIRIPFKDFFPVFRAKSLPSGPPLNPATISSIQLMLSKFEYDGQLNPAFKAGSYELPISSLTAYMAPNPSPRIVQVSSAGVTRPNRPGINVDMEPPAVKLNDMLGGLLTWKLAGEDAVRGSGVPATVVRPCALTEEPAGMPLKFDQGDVIKGKIGREDVADLVVALLSCPDARDVTFEVASTVPFSQPWTGEGGAGPNRDWQAVFAAEGLKAGVTGKTVDGVYTGKEPEAAFAKKD